MRNNINALRHPTIQRKIRHAIWLAKLAAMAKRKEYGESLTDWRGTEYVQNRHGHNILRVDWYCREGLQVWGDQSRNITAMVKEALSI